MTVSVLLPTFNRATYLGAAIESILLQSLPPLEIIVVDDGSTDRTREVCESFGDKVIYAKQPRNMGKSAAINSGLRLARGEFVWIMDDDDLAPPQALAALVAPLKENPSLGFSYGRLQKFVDDPAGRRRFDPPQEFSSSDSRPLLVRLMEDCFITGQPCVLVRKSCFDAIAPLDGRVTVSVDYNVLLLLARRFDAVDVGEVVLFQRQHAGHRGPAHARYRERERVMRWMESDARLIGALLPQLSSAEILGLRSSDRLSPQQLRLACFQRATIAGRKELWPEAFAALLEARTHWNAPLEAEDVAVLEGMLGCRYGIDGFLENWPTQRQLSRAAGPDPLGNEIRAAVASRLTYWIGQAARRLDLKRLVLTGISLFILARERAPVLALRPLLRRMRAPSAMRQSQSTPLATSN